MKITANLATGEMRVEGLERTIEISCDVRNELNGRRQKNEVVFTIPGGLPYYPRQFPAGTWRVQDVRRRSDPYRRPFFIATTAHQLVEEWEIKDGQDGKPAYDRPTGKMVEDREYGLHHSASPTTTGCIKIAHEEDVRWLVDRIHDAEAIRDNVTLEVTA
jgi:hypothetical protein